MTPKRYFTRAEAEALIPTLTGVVGPLMEAHEELTAVSARLQGEQQRIALAGGGLIDRQAWQRDKTRAEQRAAEVRRGLEAIGSLGGVAKDLGLGLVDFPHLLNGEEVNLCWRFGEKDIRFWHGLDEGFANRKPL